MDSGSMDKMNVSELTFDLQNPRLVEFDLSKSPSDAEVMKVLWEAMDVRELVLSIAASGFFQHETPDSHGGERQERCYRGEPPTCRSQGALEPNARSSA
jgi:hypothetical protein